MDAHRAAARTFAWGGAALFAAALVYFLFSYAVTFGEMVQGEADLTAILIDTALFSVFALHHSVFARGPVRAFVQSRIPAHLERSVYVWTASLMLIAVCALWRAVPGALWQLRAPWSWVMVVMQLAGIGLTVRAAAVIDPLDLAGLRWKPAAERWEFRTAGPYGWVRHPIYLGWILIVFGVATMTMTRLVFAVVSTVYILIAIPLEERTIRASAGGAYEAYMRRVRSRLLPGVY